MSYLFTYGKTPAAQTLAIVLDEIGDIKLKSSVGRIYQQFTKKLCEMDKICDESFHIWVRGKLREECLMKVQRFPSPVNTFMINLMTTAIKIQVNNRKNNIRHKSSLNKKQEWKSKHLL